MEEFGEAVGDVFLKLFEVFDLMLVGYLISADAYTVEERSLVVRRRHCCRCVLDTGKFVIEERIKEVIEGEENTVDMNGTAASQNYALVLILFNYFNLTSFLS